MCIILCDFGKTVGHHGEAVLRVPFAVGSSFPELLGIIAPKPTF